MAERLAGAEATAYHQMLATIRRHKSRNLLRENLFLAKKRLDKVGFSVPDSMRDFAAAIGWPEKAVMVPARRIRPGTFSSVEEPGLIAELNDRFSSSYMHMMDRMAINSSLEFGASFVFVTAGDVLDGDPDVVLSARSALEATATIDRRTLRVMSALELIDAKTSIMYLPGQALVIEVRSGELVVSNRVKGIPGRVQCVPYAWGRTLDRPFGRSRITRPVMDYSGMAVRIMLRQEVHAEHFSSPQRVLEGARKEAFTDEDGNLRPAWQIQTGSVWGIPDFFDEETGEWRRANLTQINAASMQPHSDHLRQIAMQFSGETSIHVDQLGIIHDNPSSADAIRAHDNPLDELVREELPNYADDRRRVAELVMFTANGYSPALERSMRRVRATFLDPGATTATGAADRATKFLAANPWAAESDVALEMWGFDEAQLERLRDERERIQGGRVMDKVLEARAGSLGVNEREKIAVLKEQFEALGIGRRAGVNAEVAARMVGLDGLKFDPGTPTTLRVDESRAVTD